jgi:FkbM family methyltransferase
MVVPVQSMEIWMLHYGRGLLLSFRSAAVVNFVALVVIYVTQGRERRLLRTAEPSLLRLPRQNASRLSSRPFLFRLKQFVVRPSPAAFHRKWHEVRDLRRVTSTWDAIRLCTWLRREKHPVQVASKYLRRNIWLRPDTSDMDVFREVFDECEYALPFIKIEPRLVVDAGANIGLTSLYFATRFPQARIVAIEPETSNVELLRRNTAAMPNITVKAGALWPRKTSLSLVDENSAKWAFSVKEASTNGEQSILPAITLPEILAEAGTNYIDILKLDIEGAEKELFSHGSQEWLSKIGVIVIELHDRLVPGCSKAFYNAILSREFRQVVSGQNIAIVFEDAMGGKVERAIEHSIAR